MEDRPRCILVMGMHRSGTSCATGLLEVLGVSVGPKSALMQATLDNPRGYFENLEFNGICNDLLEAAGAEWWRIRDFDISKVPEAALAEGIARLETLLSRFSESPVFALKDPRLCLLLQALRPVFPDPVFLHVVRSPVEVAMSLNKRNGFGLAEGIALWDAYNRGAIAATTGEPRLLIDYAEIMANAKASAHGLIADLHDLGISGLALQDPASLTAVVDGELHRQKTTVAASEKLLTEPQSRFWASLQSGHFPDLEETPEARAHRHLMLTSLEAQVTVQQARSAEAKRENERKEQREALGALQSEIGRDRDEARRLRAQVEEIKAKTQEDLRALQAQIGKASDENRQLEAQIQKLRSGVSEMHGKLEAARVRMIEKPSLLCKIRRALSRAKYRLDNWNDPIARSLLDKIKKDFDRHYYYAKYSDVRRTCIDPRVHFLRYGWQERRKPHPRLNVDDLVAKYPEIRRQGTAEPKPVETAPARAGTSADSPATGSAPPSPPIGGDTAYLATRQEVLASGFWDERWYLRHYYGEYRAWKAGRTVDADPVDHFLQAGAAAGNIPSPLLRCEKAYSFRDMNPVSAFLHKVRPDFHFDENVWIPGRGAIGAYLAARSERSERVSKKVVYACNLGNYDSVMQPYALKPDWDYVLFSDDEWLVRKGRAGVWEVRPALRPDLPPDRRNRFHKLHPHLLFPDHEESVYVDGNVNIISSFLFDEIRLRNLTILLPQHFGRTCAYDEIEKLLQSSRTSEENRAALPRQRDFLSAMGLPKDYGLTENNIIYRRHHDATIVRVMKRWWEQIVAFSSRDQVSLSYVLWKEGIVPADVSIPPARLLNQDFWIVAHRAERQVPAIEVAEKIAPAFAEHCVAAVLSSNESFVGYLAVVITSLIENASDGRNYDIIVLEKDISEASKDLVRSLARPNASIRFYNMNSLLAKLSHLEVHVEGYVPAETYNKIFLGEIMEGYEKVLYIDTDIVIRKDIAELYDTDLFGKALGASPNIANIHAARLNKEIKGRKFGDYLRDELGIDDFSRYFQAGIILLDLSSEKGRNLLELSLRKLDEIKQPIFFDQCIFNSIFYGDVRYVSTTWNHVWYLQNYSYLKHTLDDGMFFDYARSRLDPKIVHYAGKDKPTNKFDWRLSSHFWHYAARSPYADALLEEADAAWFTAHEDHPQLDRLSVERPPRLLVHLHAYHEDQLPYMLGKLANIGGADLDLVVTTSATGYSLDQAVKSSFANAEILRLKNQGFDVYPFLKVLQGKNLSQYDYILKLHTKSPRPETAESKVYGVSVPGHRWRNELVDALLGSPEVFVHNLDLLQEDPGLGCIAAEDFIFSINENREQQNYDLRHWMNRFRIETGEHYVGGTMFLARSFPFERLKAVKPDDLDFASGSSTSGAHKNLAHVFERLFGLAVEGERLSFLGRTRASADPAVRSSALAGQ